MNILNKKNKKNWTSKTELMINLQISPDTIEQIISNLTCSRPADTQSHINKGNYETIFHKAGLEYGKDYEELVFNGCKFPTCMISPTAFPKLISYLHIL